MATFISNIFKLRFKGPLHLGTGRNDNYDHTDELIHSDTIKSALYVVYRQLYPKAIENDDDLSFFHSFTVSSAFPYYENELFFPKPLAGVNIEIEGLDKQQSSKLSKQGKKIQYIGLKAFEKLIDGNTIACTQQHLDDSGRFLFSEPQPNTPKIMIRQVQQRVYIPHQDEENQNSQPYFIERLYFDQKAGLYFLLQTQNQNLLPAIKTCLRMLGETGFGTDKNIGNGQFEADFDEMKITRPDNPSQVMALSLFCPTREAVREEYLQHSAFATRKRSGFIVSAQDEAFRHFRKKSVYMFTEGSCFPVLMPATGKIVNLKPETVASLHPVWRDGTCMFLPIKHK